MDSVGVAMCPLLGDAAGDPLAIPGCRQDLHAVADLVGVGGLGRRLLRLRRRRPAEVLAVHVLVVLQVRGRGRHADVVHVGVLAAGQDHGRGPGAVGRATVDVQDLHLVPGRVGARPVGLILRRRLWCSMRPVLLSGRRQFRAHMTARLVGNVADHRHHVFPPSGSGIWLPCQLGGIGWRVHCRLGSGHRRLCGHRGRCCRLCIGASCFSLDSGCWRLCGFCRCNWGHCGEHKSSSQWCGYRGHCCWFCDRPS
mmetsp:Transcript_30116/g.86393  ORF Transcript_30116/g.86393 Transcript_30116/m.86393 type:complete len:253 (-) Transcript_30116:267-1025(-)